MARYYETTVTFTVLSDRRLRDCSLESLLKLEEEGEILMGDIDAKANELSKDEMIDATYEYGSDPSHFGIDDEQDQSESTEDDEDRLK